MADHQVDLLVIGAGASGASVAYEATRRGLSVALLEAGDIGGGTSCRSTKLLHGGCATWSWPLKLWTWHS